MYEYKDIEYPSGIEELEENTIVHSQDLTKFEKKILTDLIKSEMNTYKSSPKDETYFALEKILRKIS